VDKPILRARPEVGQQYDDPSEDLIFMLLADIEAGEGNFLIIERTADPTGHTYGQTHRNDDGSYLVEYRAGGADQHFQTVAADMRTAHALLTAWAFELDGWREQADWSRLEL
jgi:hypothetical protein